MADHYSREESDLLHENMRGAITAEIRGVQSAMNARIDKLATKEDLDAMMKKIEPVTDAYKAMLLSRGFIVGLAGVVLAISAIGAGFIWLINHAIGK